jgi:hypothetical protein
MSGPNVKCVMGKRVYFRESLAVRAVSKAAHRGELQQLKHYACEACGFWHLSKKYPVRAARVAAFNQSQWSPEGDDAR